MKNSKSGRPMVKGVPLKQPPWKGNNPNPNHFYRYNYLEEDEDVANERRYVVFIYMSNYTQILSRFYFFIF